MKRLTVTLAEMSGIEPALVGGKAARLGELAKIGVTVPDAFVVLASAYHEYVQKNELGPRIERMLHEVSVHDLKFLEETSAKIGALFTAQRMPPEIAGEIASKYQELGQPAAAVRSSATAEDLPGASFAGQYDTFLNMRGTQDVVSAVVSCWASLWSFRAISYRLAKHLAQHEADLGMACIIQELVEAEKSGVLFTSNPLNGDSNQIVINSCFGLGEGVVSGDFACGHLVVDKHSGETVQTEWGNQELKSVPDPNGDSGTLEVPLSQEEREGSTLSTDELAGLVQAAKMIEDYYGHPQDIEWALRADKLYILQSRDVTSQGRSDTAGDVSGEWVSEFDTTIDPRYPYYATANVKEVCPGPLTPLTMSDLIRGFDDAFIEVNREFGLMKGIDPETEFSFLGLFYNHVYLNISVCSDVMARLPAFGAEELTRTFPPDADELWEKKFHPTAAGLLRLPRIGWSIALNAIRKLQETRDFTFECRKRFPKDGTDLERQNNRYIMFWIDRIGRLRDSMMVTHIALTQLAIFFYHLLFELTDRWIECGAQVAPRILSSIGEIAGAMPMVSIWDLSRLVLASPALRAVFDENPPAGLPAALIAISHEEKGEFMESLAHFMDRFGHRSVFECEAMSLSWAEDPTYVYSVIKNYLPAEDSLSPVAIWSRQDQAREATLRACLDELGLIKGTIFKAVIKAAQRYIERREHMKDLLVEVIVEMKKAYRVLSRRFAAEGIIEDPGDFYFLTMPEIRKLAAEKADDIPVMDLVRSRKAEYHRNAEVQLPEVSRGRPIPLSVAQMAAFEGLEVLEGIAVSPGTYTGKARVITDLHEAVEILPGEVLVAPVTDAAWTPLFVPAGAIVVDLGGPLSHGSIVAREYGIPGVINVGVGTRVIADGQLVTVDGTSGKVYLGKVPDE